jgi:hypothetical protein
MSLNDERAALGRDAFATFTASVFRQAPEQMSDRDDAMFDLLTCLRHYAMREDVDFGEALERSSEFFKASLIAPDGVAS